MNYYLVSSGVVSSGIMLTMDDLMSVLDTGLAEYTTVNSGGWLGALDNGVVLHTTVNSNGFFQVSNEGMAHDTVVNSSGSMTVFSGGTASGTTLNGGNLYVYGGVIVSTTVSGDDFRSYLGVSSGGVAVSTTVTGEDARMILRSGCTAISTVIDHDGYMRVSGGSADGISIGPGATLEVKNGGTATNVVWTPTEGEIEIEDGSTITFASNYTGVYLGKNDHLLSHSTVMNGLNIGNKTMAVMPGGTANSCTVGPEGCVSVWMGASIDRLTVSGGELLVFSGGTATNVIWTPTEGNVYFYDGAVVTYVSSYSGVYYGSNGHLLSNTAMMSGKTVDENSNMHVFNGGMAVSTVIDDDGEMRVWSGGIARSTTLSGDGEMHLNAGGIAEYTKIMDGGLDVDSDAVANDTSIYNDGNLEISGGAVASNTMVFGGHFEVDDGAVANNTTVSGGALQISKGGIANSNTIFSGGYLHVWGGTANFTTVNSDGQLSVNSSGMANSTSVNGGWLWAIGGTANNTIVDSGGELSVERGGTANGTIVNNSGVLFVDSFGTASDTTINSDGQLTVNSGGMVNNTAVNSGIMQVFFSGTANNTTVNSGGYLQTMGGKLTGNLKIAEGAVVSMSDLSILDFDISGRTADSPALVNDLSLISGTPTYTITVSADQTAGVYTLAGGAADFAGTVSIGTDGSNYGSLTVNGDALNYEGYTFRLILENEDLELLVTDPSILTVDDTIFLDDGGTYDQVIVLPRWWPAFMVVDGTVNHTDLYGAMYVTGNSNIYDTVVHSGGWLDLGYSRSGDIGGNRGIVDGITVKSGGRLRLCGDGVYSWGYEGNVPLTVTNVLVQAGGEINGFIFDHDVFFDDTVHDVTISNVTIDGYLDPADLIKGWTATDVVIEGVLNIHNGAAAENVTVSENGNLSVAAGGTATNITAYKMGISRYITPIFSPLYLSY